MVREASRPVREGKWSKSSGYRYIDYGCDVEKRPGGRPVPKSRGDYMS
jgi:hypothetical protein